VDPADATVATHLKPHKVVFQSADPNDPTGDPAKVVVRSGHGGQSVSARAGSLADVSGGGHWAGDVFGTGTASTVDFTVADAGDGTPDITGIGTTGEAAVIGEVKHLSGDGHDGHDGHEGDGSSSAARVSITFTSASGDQTRSLTIAVRVHTGDEHNGAKISITLGRTRGVAVDAATAAGVHTWNGTLCDGSAASITYTVAADGAVTDVSAMPTTATVHSDGGKIIAKFSDHEWAFVNVRAHDGMIKVSAGAMLHCNSGDPTTNVDVKLPPPDASKDGSSDGFGRGNHHGGQHGGD
jgi:hypothetical protein